MHAVELRVRPPGGSFPGVDSALAASPAISREALLNLDWLDDGGLTLLYRLAADGEAAIADALDDHEDVRAYQIVPVEDDTFYAFVHVQRSELVADLLSVVEEYALLLDRPFRFVDDSVVVTLAGDQAAASEAFDRVRELVDVSVEWMGEYEPEGMTPLSRLTDRQREALEAAFELGFYETPREASYEELGEALDCAPSTANALLRRTEAALVTAVLE